MKRYAMARRSTPGRAGARNRSGSRAIAPPASDAALGLSFALRSHGSRMDSPGDTEDGMGSAGADRVGWIAVRNAPAGRSRHRGSSGPRRRRTGNRPRANTMTPNAEVSDQAVTARPTPGSTPKADSAWSPSGGDRRACSRLPKSFGCPSPGPEERPGTATTA
jgi:hypothetical protein